MKRRTEGIIRLTPAADYSAKEGYGVVIAGNVATISASATVPWDGVIVEGGTVAQECTVAVLGSVPGGVDVKLSGIVARGAKLIQAADGTAVTDSGAGARVQIGVVNEAGVAGDLVETFLRTPLILA